MRSSGQTDHDQQVARLYDIYAPRIAAYALRRAPTTDAADIVSETFLVAWRRCDSIPEEPETLPWLYGVARRVLSNQRRSKRRQSRLRDRLNGEFRERFATQPPLEAAEEFRRVTDALDQLSPDDAELLRLTAWEALSAAEIALTMDIEPNAVRQRIHRARKRLRECLAVDDFDHEIAPCSEGEPLELRTESQPVIAYATFGPHLPEEVRRNG